MKVNISNGMTKEKESIIGKYDTLKECLDAYNKLREEGRNVFWGQYPEGYYAITEVKIDMNVL